MNDNDKVVMIPFFVAESMADRYSRKSRYRDRRTPGSLHSPTENVG